MHEDVVARVKAVQERLGLAHNDVAAFAHISPLAWDSARGITGRLPASKTLDYLARFLELNEGAQHRSELKAVP